MSLLCGFGFSLRLCEKLSLFFTQSREVKPKALRKNQIRLNQFNADTGLDRLRSDPPFVTLMRSLGPVKWPEITGFLS